MEVTLAETAGFCMGVKRAIELALDAAQRHKTSIYTYGPLIHNPHVLEMLHRKGIHEIADPFSLSSGVLIIRAHGIPPQERRHLEETGLVLIDATCPRVNVIHVKIRQYLHRGYSIVVFGDPAHAEVIGLMGAGGEKAYLVSDTNDIATLPSEIGPCLLVAQTTQSREAYAEMRDLLQSKFSSVVCLDTLCATTDLRQQEVIELAKTHDAVVVVGGKTSANTIRLAALVRDQGKPVYHVETEEELPEDFPPEIGTIAVTAGASTPTWMIERVVDYLETFTKPRTLPNIVLIGLKLITESNILVAVGSGTLALTCTWYLDGEILILPLLIAVGYVFSMHILNHFADRESVAINEPLREEVFQRHQAIFIIVGIIAGLLALTGAAWSGLEPFLLVFFATVTGAAYSFPVVPRILVPLVNFRRLKDIPASKDIVVALAWSSITVLLPAYATERGQFLPAGLLSVWSFAFLLVYIRCLLLDIKDIQGDRLLGRETLPLLLGEMKAIRLVKILILGIISIIVTSVLFENVHWSMLLQITAILPVVLVAYDKKRFRTTRRYYLQAVLDTSFLLSGALTLLALISLC